MIDHPLTSLQVQSHPTDTTKQIQKHVSNWIFESVKDIMPAWVDELDNRYTLNQSCQNRTLKSSKNGIGIVCRRAQLASGGQRLKRYALSTIVLIAVLPIACTSFRTSRTELQMTSYPADPTAEAVILERSGKVIASYKDIIEQTGTYNSVKRLSNNPTSVAFRGMSSYTLEIHCRIKILNEAGIRRGRVVDVLPQDAELMSFQAATLLPNGQIVKVDKSMYNRRKRTIEINMPQVQILAVLEYEYKYSSNDLSTMAGWIFQSDIPVVKSIFSFKMMRGTNFPYKFVKSDEGQQDKPTEIQVLGMDNKNWMILQWELNQLPAIRDDTPKAGIVIVG